MKYKLKKDDLVKVWARSYYEIEASSLEEAISKINADEDCGLYDYQILYDTIANADPWENKFLATSEIMNTNNETVWENSNILEAFKHYLSEFEDSGNAFDDIMYIRDNADDSNFDEEEFYDWEDYIEQEFGHYYGYTEAYEEIYQRFLKYINLDDIPDKYTDDMWEYFLNWID